MSLSKARIKRILFNAMIHRGKKKGRMKREREGDYIWKNLLFSFIKSRII
jgi:hypothetical protein